MSVDRSRSLEVGAVGQPPARPSGRRDVALPGVGALAPADSEVSCIVLLR
jgi:hypothetical protein